MSSTAAALAVPSPDDVLREIRQFSPGMQLYRGHDQWFKFQFGGRDYHFPPDVGGRLVKHPVTGQMVPGDGVLRIKDVYGRQQEKLSRRFTGAVGLIEGQEVSSILMFAISNHAQEGVVWLLGNETDEARKKASRTLVRNHLKAWAEQQRDARAGFVENWKKIPTNAGRATPRPTDNQRRAQRYLDLLAEEGSEGFQYVCEHGCSDFEQFEEYALHMKVNHGKTVTKEGPAEEPPAAPMVGSDKELTPEEIAAAEAAERLAAEEAERAAKNKVKAKGK